MQKITHFFLLLFVIQLHSQILDSSFGTTANGIVTNQFSTTADLNSINDAIMQPDGKMVYVGGIGLNGFNSFYNPFVARINEDGTLDSTFNGTGFHIIKKIVTSNDQLFYTIKLQTNGKIVVAERNKIYQFNTDGCLDTSFENGIYIPTTIMNMVIQSDGKIVLTGFESDGTNNVFKVIRLNLDGSFDVTFGNGGAQTIDFINNVDNYSYDVAIQSDNKIIIAGSVFNYTTYTDFAIARLTDSGILDTTFGNVGTIFTPLSGTQIATSIAIQPDGKILLGGTSDGMFAAIRYNADGFLDTTFNNTGQLTTTLSTPTSFDPTKNKQTIKYLTTDKILISGTSNSDFALIQLNIDGTTDTDFGTNGITLFDAGKNENAKQVNLKPDGKIIVAGNTSYSGGVNHVGATEKIQQLQFSSYGILESNYQLNLINGTDKIISVIEQIDGKTIALTSTKNNLQTNNINLVKYYIDGSIDNTFGINGKVSVSNVLSFTLDYLELKQQTDGKILISGDNLSIYRFNSNGSVDNSFGTNGIVDLSTGLNYQLNFINNIFPQPDGKIFVTGELILDSQLATTSLGLIKLNSDGTIDTTYGTNGSATTRFDYFGSNSDEFAKEIFIQSDGKIVVTCSINTAYGFNPTDKIIGITRFNSNGFLDTNFGTNGYVINTNSKSFEIELLGYSDDKFIINFNSSNTIGATAKYNSNGFLDNSFGSNGIVIDPIFYNDMIVQSDGKILKAGVINNQFYITRFDNNGSIDSTFGTNGSLNTTINSYSEINKITLLQNNKLLACGYSFNGTNQVFAQARYILNNLNIENNVNSNLFKIYPNPASSQITIDLGNEIKSTDYKVKINNLLGQEVFSSFLRTNTSIIPITWPEKGLYFVNIFNYENNLIKVDKLIIK